MGRFRGKEQKQKGFDELVHLAACMGGSTPFYPAKLIILREVFAKAAVAVQNHNPADAFVGVRAGKLREGQGREGLCIRDFPLFGLRLGEVHPAPSGHEPLRIHFGEGMEELAEEVVAGFVAAGQNMRNAGGLYVQEFRQAGRGELFRP